MTLSVNLVVNCTNRKSARAGRPVEFREVLNGNESPTPKTHIDPWLEALRDSETPPVAAQELYVGAHWAIARELPQDFRSIGIKATLWVASAGYGLIEDRTKVKPYSATFASEKLKAENCVAPRGPRSQVARHLTDWWNLLAKRRAKVLGREWAENLAPRHATITELVAADPQAMLVVAASAPYLAAISDDLTKAFESMGDKGSRRCLIFSANSHVPDRLEPCLVPSSARLEPVLAKELPGDQSRHSPGARQALNVNLIRYLILRAKKRDSIGKKLLSLESDAVRGHFEGLLKREDAQLPIFNRTGRIQDDEVRDFINRRLSEDDRLSASRLLSEFRNVEQKRCEQKRFRELYKRERENSLSTLTVAKGEC